MVRYCLKGDYAAAKKINDVLFEGYNILFFENNPAGVKAFLAEAGLISNHLRLPLVPLSKEGYKRVKSFTPSMSRLQVQDL